MSAAQSTCSIGIKRHSVSGRHEFFCGTAFFVGPTILLTAGHAVNDSRDKIVIELPGTLKATYFLERLFKDPQPGANPRFECKLVETLFGKANHADISVLEVVGPYKSNSFIEVTQQILPRECDGVVDVLGYPGEYSAREVMKMHPVPEQVNNDMVDDVHTLFPKRELIITHGSIKIGGNQPHYRVSTVKGMSGGPVLMKGKVIGNFFSTPTVT